MNKSELVDAVAERTGTDRAVARRHVDAVFEAIIDTVTSGDRVLVTGFGTFDRFARPARTARNPRTGQSIEVAAADVPRFRVGQTFKNRVADGGAVQVTPPAEAAKPAKPAASKPAAEAAPSDAASAEVKKAKKPKKAKQAKKEPAAKKATAKKPGGKKKGTSSKKAAK
ncbi:HU family DNA-binding protein [Actinomadura sp. 9N407]|uniref:HU family DNA-binding protein n=1 Tax=Actinomadura sp. 9N407 TaxID=3375154 RepID=UPI003794CB4B